MATGTQQGGYFVGSEILKRNWGWFLALGIAEIVLGAVALGASVLVTLATMVLFGWLLLVGGVLSTGHAFFRKQWSGFFIDLVTGILYAVAGFMVVANPAESAATLTLLIALFLFLSGIFRIVVALTGQFQHRGWVLVNGVITLALGIMIWRQWPLSGLWVIGLFIGIDMVVYGWSLVMLSLMAKNAPEPAGAAVP